LGVFDLGFSATSFHWLDEDSALAKIASLLKPGGWWAAAWHVFGHDGASDAFHEATRDLLSGGPHSPSRASAASHLALDVEARTSALLRAKSFDSISHRQEAWTLWLTPNEVAQLYGTYSEIAARPDRAEILSKLRRIAIEDFGGRVNRNMITALYVARRKPH
jgi:hypothetical protein